MAAEPGEMAIGRTTATSSSGIPPTVARPPAVGGMAGLKRNVIANLSGNLYTVVISLVFVPIYIHYLGIEAWGLVGFSVTLQAVLAVADMGLSTTLNREMARLSAGVGI